MVTVGRFEISKAIRNLFFINIARQVLDLRTAMETNDFNRGREIAERIRQGAISFDLEELSSACTWMDKVCQEKRLDGFFHAFQVIEAIISRHVNISALRLAA